MHSQRSVRVGNSQLAQVVGFPHQCRWVEDYVPAEESVDAGESAGAELGERVPPAVGELHVMAGLGAAAVADDEIGIETPAKVVHRRTLALVAESQANRDD